VGNSEEKATHQNVGLASSADSVLGEGLRISAPWVDEVGGGGGGGETWTQSFILLSTIEGNENLGLFFQGRAKRIS